MPKQLWDAVKEVLRRKFILNIYIYIYIYKIKKAGIVSRKPKITPSEASKLIINNIM